MLSFIRKNLKILIPLLILGIVIAFTLHYQFTKQNSSVPAPTGQEKELVKETDDILTRQKSIRNFYTSQPLDEQTKAMVFYELMGPLGGLDPIEKPAEIKDVHATVNFLFGAYFGVFHFPTDEAGYAATAPIRNESDFDEKDFFNKNKSTLEQLAETFENDNNLHILNWGYSTNYRINDYFGDDVRKFYWKISTDTSPFYSYEVVQPDSKDYEALVSLKKEYGMLINKMAGMKIQSVYTCDDKVIIIVDGLSDNAFGYIYNAQSASEVNCGVLKGRFRIYSDEVIADKWRFWFAK